MSSSLLPPDAPHPPTVSIGLCHRDAMVLHAIKRLWRRHGVALSFPEYDALCGRLQLSSPIAHDRYGQPVYRVTFDQRRRHPITSYALWSTAQACIITFYPTLAWLRVPSSSTITPPAEATGVAA